MTAYGRRYLLTLAVICALALLAGVAGATPVQWVASSGGNDHWYDFVDNDSMNWTAARDAAAASSYLGGAGHLVAINSASENAFVAGLHDMSHYWLGGYQPLGQATPGAAWTWVTGEPWSYANWAAGEPNDQNGSEDNAEQSLIGWTIGGTWNDVPSGMFQDGYVVEFDTPSDPGAVPEPTSLALLGVGLAGLIIKRRKAAKS